MFKKSGWIFIDKPIGLTSNSLLQKVRLNLDKVKAGFVGTLDPLASGYLPIAIGHATKVINLAEKVNKEYIFTICWGKQVVSSRRYRTVIVILPSASRRCHVDPRLASRGQTW